MKQTKSARLHIRLTPSDKKALEKIAKNHKMSIGKLIIEIALRGLHSF